MVQMAEQAPDSVLVIGTPSVTLALSAYTTVFVITFGSAGNMAVPKRIISRGSSPLPDLFRVAVQ